MSRRLRVAIGVNAILLSKGRILILRRSAHSPQYAGRWDLPGGMVELGESLETALKREVKEETGLWVRILRPVAARILFASPTNGGICVTFLCGIHGRRNPKLNPGEHGRFRWVAPESALRLNLRPPQTQAIRAFLSAR